MLQRYCIVIFMLLSAASHAQMAATYRPYGLAIGPSDFQLWDSLRQSIQTPTADVTRPNLPGVSGRNLELLQDAVARKYHKATDGSKLPIAQENLSRTTQSSLPRLRGIMSEAIFLDKNPDWNYVEKSNAPQNDVWAKMPNGRRGLRTGQVKYHFDGNPGSYARDMLEDHISGRFIVPDDHVAPLREYLRNNADRLQAKAAGFGHEVRCVSPSRVSSIGATASEIDSITRAAISEARIRRIPPYAFMGVMSALITAPTFVDWYQGNIEKPEAVTRLKRDGSVILVGVGTDQALKHLKGGLIRGTTRGNAIVACVALLVDTSLHAKQHGGIENAFHSPDFLISLGGNTGAVGGALLGTHWGAKGGAIIALALGQAGPQVAVPEEVATVPAGTVIGGIVGATFGGVVGQFGGASGTRWFLETFCPEKLFEQERVHVENVRDGVHQRISALQTI